MANGIPSWIATHVNPYNGFDEIPPPKFDEVNDRLARRPSGLPLVSILIAAWNEEVNILNCVSSLADQETDIPFEIIVINNNSTDKTQETINQLRVRTFFQPIQGVGPARQLGQERARGKYILLADADCVYPACWLDKMITVLAQKDVVCVYGRYSFMPDKGYPRWKLYLLERMKDVVAEIRHVRRPYLNAYGISMGYVRELGLRVGYVMHKIRGNDGRLCFDLMSFGKVKQVRSNKARAWTNPRTLQLEGGFSQALFNRLKKETKRFGSFFRPMAPHDTKTSEN